MELSHSMGLTLYKALIYVLKNTNYQVSLRPHPNESVENYKNLL